jgi:FKBP-type peptidyl-prolyl cis-trans isomerase SlyD
MEIAKQKAVTVEYTLTNDAGEVLDTSGNHGPLTYIQGVGNMIPGFELALEGKKSGDKFSFNVSPADGYGEKDTALMFSVPKERFEVQTPNGTAIMAVDRIEQDSVVLDGNHPLAGNALHFDVEVLGVRDATDEELEQAQSGGQGCGCACDDSGCGGCH